MEEIRREIQNDKDNFLEMVYEIIKAVGLEINIRLTCNNKLIWQKFTTSVFRLMLEYHIRCERTFVDRAGR